MAVGVGIVLRVVAYTRRSILWLDEAAIARIVSERSLVDLLSLPLGAGQAAPPGFLFLQWAVTRIAGTSEMAWRLVPFVSAVASVFLFRAIARRMLTPIGALAAVAFFAVGYWFLVYAAEAKPYGLDLALSLAALLLVFDLRRDRFPKRRTWIVAILGAVAMLFSNATVLTLVGLGATLGVVTAIERGVREAARALWPIALCWGLGAGLASWRATRSMSAETMRFMEAVWQHAMVPVPRSWYEALWLWREWKVELSTWHGWSITDPNWTALYVALALLGLLGLAVRRPRDAAFAVGLVAAYVLASAARQYPYSARFTLAPLAMLILGIGESIGRFAAAGRGPLGAATRALAVLLCVPPLYRVAAFPPPYQWTPVGAFLEQIRARWQPGDVVYVTHGRALEVLYHAARFGLSATDYIVGPCDLSDPRAALRAADRVRGRTRAWVIVDPGFYFSSSPEYAYLRAIGVRRDSLGDALPGTFRHGPRAPYDLATAYLFDLSDSARLARASAETYRFSPHLRPNFENPSRWACYGVFSPLVREWRSGDRS